MPKCETTWPCGLTVVIAAEATDMPYAAELRAVQLLTRIAEGGESPVIACADLDWKEGGSLSVSVEWTYGGPIHIACCIRADSKGWPILKAGGLEFDWQAHADGGYEPGDVGLMVIASTVCDLSYGPRQVMRWLANECQALDLEPLAEVIKAHGNGAPGGEAAGDGGPDSPAEQGDDGDRGWYFA